MKWKAIIMMALVIAMLAQVASAWIDKDWERTCFGNVLVSNKTIVVAGDVITLEENVTCSYGCDSGRRQCTDFSGPPGTAVPGEIFLFFEVISISLLFLAFVDSEADRKTIFSLFAVILFFPLGLMSFNVMFGSVAQEMIWLGWLNWTLGMISLLIFFYGVLLIMKERTQIV